MKITVLFPKILRFRYLLIVAGFISQDVLAQFPSQLPNSDTFTISIDEAEQDTNGVAVYDQYCSYNKEPLLRKKADGSLYDGKITDNYKEGMPLHKGIYEDGLLTDYSNFYGNGSFERNYKSKGDGAGDLEVFFLNGYYREVRKYNNFKIYHHEIYHDNGVLSYQEVRNKKSMVPSEIVAFSYKNKLIRKVELTDKKNSKYLESKYLANGKLTEQGELYYSSEEDRFLHDGTWHTYNKSKISSEVIYEKGKVKEVVSDKRPEDEQVYYNDVIEGVQEDEVASEKVNISESSAIPSNIARFDYNSDAFISNKEVDMAVSEFFDDDSIELTQINSLVNFFFDQD